MALNLNNNDVDNKQEQPDNITWILITSISLVMVEIMLAGYK